MDKKLYLQVPGFSNNSINNDRAKDKGYNYYGPCIDNNNSNDKYTAAIELSNKCREFYKSRVEAANNMKSRWCESKVDQGDNEDTDSSFSTRLSSSSDVNDNEKMISNKQQRVRVDQAMEKLRTEMASLMDQDLSLMKQLLTLNETIEELKWQSHYYSCNTSWTSFSASKNLDSSFSVSDTEMYDSQDNVNSTVQNTPNSSKQQAHTNTASWNTKRNVHIKDYQKASVDSVGVNVENVQINQISKTTTSKDITPETLAITVEAPILVNVTKSRFSTDRHTATMGVISVHHERGENSFDSGIHESTSGDELPWRT